MKELEKNSLKLFSELVSEANYFTIKKKYNKALLLLKRAAWIQYVFSKEFTNEEIESQLKEISSHIYIDYNISQDTYLFYDDFAIDNLGLTQQYLRGLISSGKKIVFFTTKVLGGQDSIDIYNEIQAAENVNLVYYKKTGRPYDDAMQINRIISSYRPDKVFMHLKPDSVEAVTAFYALPKKTIKYNIDLQDHTYWVGSGVVDYDIVFRSYGFNIAEHFRGIDKEKILFQPYYPIFNKARKFEGFPIGEEDKIIIVSGSEYYKVFSEDNIFQNFVIRVLDENPNVIYFFAGSGNHSIFNILTKQKKYKNRFFLLGHRKDIFQVLKHSDIYVNTFPIGGGLMAHLAAYNNLPIMSFDYSGNGISLESVLCQKKKVKITHDSLNSMYSQLVKYINHEEERKKFGKSINECVIDADWFNTNFNRILNLGYSEISCEQFSDEFFNDELRHHRTMQDEQNFYIWILQHVKWQSLKYCPKLLMNAVLSFCSGSGIRIIMGKIRKEILNRYNSLKGYKNI